MQLALCSILLVKMVQGLSSLNEKHNLLFNNTEARIPFRFTWMFY